MPGLGKALADVAHYQLSARYPIVSCSRETVWTTEPFGPRVYSNYELTIDEAATKEERDAAIADMFDIEVERGPKARQVILSDPATVVIWQDGTKTVTKAKDGDEYDARVGLLLCAVRKASRNRVRAIDMEDAVRAVAVLEESQMRALSDALLVVADNFGDGEEER